MSPPPARGDTFDVTTTSDVAPRQEAATSLYAAIDLHSSNSALAVVDGQGTALLQCRRPNDLPRLMTDLAPYREELVGVAVESTHNWYWLVDGLMAHGYAVRLVNTTAIPQYDGLKHGDDHSDALHLAQLMRLCLLPEGYIYPREQRATRDLLRRRFALVRQASRLMLSIQSSFSRTTGKQLSGNALRQLTPTQLVELFPDLATRYGVLIQFKLLEKGTSLIKAGKPLCQTTTKFNLPRPL